MREFSIPYMAPNSSLQAKPPDWGQRGQKMDMRCGFLRCLVSTELDISLAFSLVLTHEE